jgi:hypothetical protein
MVQCCLLLAAALLLVQPMAPADDRALNPYPANPRYLALGDLPIFPLGAPHHHGWTPISRPHVNLMQDLDRLADVMERIGSPHVRGFVRCLPYDPMNHLHDGQVETVLQPWKRLDGGRYDLEQFEPRWEARLVTFLKAARARGIVVSLEVWDDWSITRGPGGQYDPGANYAWNGHPFNPNNNVNYGPDVLPETTQTCDAPFYRTIPSKADNAPVLRLQQRYVGRLVELAGNYPNVLWNVANESRATLDWSRYWADYLRQRLPEERMIGDMPSTNRRDGGGECDPQFHAGTLATDNRYDVVDVGQAVSRHEFGEDAALQAIGGGERIRRAQVTMEEVGRLKPQVVSKEYQRGPDGGTTVLWGRFAGGAAAARFHRPSAEHGPEISHFQYEAIERLGRFIAGVEFWHMQPLTEVIAGLPAGSAGANVLGRPGDEYVIQLAGGSAGEVALRLASGSWRLWIYEPSRDAYIDVAGDEGREVEVTGGRLALTIPAYDETLIIRAKRE